MAADDKENTWVCCPYIQESYTDNERSWTACEKSLGTI